MPDGTSDGMAEYGRRVVDHADVARTRISMVPRMSTMPKRRGVEDVNGFAGVDGVGRVLGGGHGALRRRRPWSAVKRLRRQGELLSAARSRRAEAAGI